MLISSSFGRRRRLTCFYCGHKTHVVTSTSNPVTSFTCSSPYCQSVNQLDKDGNIVDYSPDTPQSPPPPAPRYGRPLRSPSPDARPSAPGQGSPVFCRTCEKHLAIKNNLLADYLPPEDYLDFQVYWDKLPEFKRHLEEKYPEPCGPCAEKAQQRIKQANYFARTAMIGKYLQQGKNLKAGAYQEPWGPSRILKLAIWVVRGILWYGLHVLVISWHFTTMLYPTPLHDTVDITGTWGQCIKKSYEAGKVDSSCQEVTSVLAGKLLWASTIVCCWNYRGLENSRKPKAKLTGYDIFMVSEGILLIIRLGSYLYLTPGWIRSDFPTEVLRKVHFVLFLSALVGGLYSMTALKLIMPPPINLKEAVSPLGANTPSGTPPKHQWNQDRSRSIRARAPSPPQPYFSPVKKQPNSMFPPRSSDTPQQSLNNNHLYSRGGKAVLSSQQQKQYSNDADEMDWNPTSPQPPTPRSYWNPFASSTTNNPPAAATSNPFADPIPLAPKTSMFQSFVWGQAPKQQQQPQAHTKSNEPPQRESFFRPANGGIHGVSSGTGTEPKYPPMADARFFPKNAADGEDTGLEGLLSGGLKLEDEPEVVRNARAEGVRHREHGVSLWEILVRLGLAGVACMVYYYLGAPPKSKLEVDPAAVFTDAGEPLIGPPQEPTVEDVFQKYAAWAKIGSLIVTLLCPVWKLIRKQSNTPISYEEPDQWDLEKILLAAESMAGVMLLIFTAGNTNPPQAEVLGKMYLGWVLARKVWDLVVFLQASQQSRNPPSQEDPEPPRRREVSPGLGDWVLPLEQRNAAKTAGARAGAVASGINSTVGRPPATLSRDGSSNLSGMALGGFKRENSGAVGAPGMRRDESGGLSGMVSDAGRVNGIGMGGRGGLRREASGGFGGMANGGWREKASFRKESGGGGGAFGGLSLN